MIGTDIWKRKEQARQAALQMTVLCLEADSLPSGSTLSHHRVCALPCWGLAGCLTPSKHCSCVSHSRWSSQKQRDWYHHLHFTDLETKRLKPLWGSRQLIYIQFTNIRNNGKLNQNYYHNQINVENQRYYVNMYSLSNLFKLAVSHFSLSFLRFEVSYYLILYIV